LRYTVSKLVYIKYFIIVLTGLLLLNSCARFQHTESYSVKESKINSGGDVFTKYNLETHQGNNVEYYISKTDKPVPLVLWIQGSGCRPAFAEASPGDYASTIFSFTTLAQEKKISMMVVNKPFSPRKVPSSRGVSTDCPNEFNSKFSVDLWSKHLSLALNHARNLPWVDDTKVLLIGTSEGATMAAKLAGFDKSITNIALVGATGPSQLFDFIAKVYLKDGSDADKLKEINGLEETYKGILNDVENESNSWGHSNLRWQSFFKSSSISHLEKSNARIYLVSGMSDNSVPSLSTEVLYVEMLTKGKDVTFRRIPEGEHNLVTPKGSIFDQDKEFLMIIDWFLKK